MAMYGTVKYAEYNNLDAEIKRTMKRSAGDAVLLGFLLRRMMDEKLWEGLYGDLDSYLRQELHMDYTMASRFVRIHEKYSADGGREIGEKWADYSQSVLIEMLNMEPELMEKVTPDMTTRQVREIKRQARKEPEPEREEVSLPVDNPFSEVQEPADDAEERMSERMPREESQQAPEEERFPDKDDVPDAEFRELEPEEKVATPQLPELVRPDQKQAQYLDDFARRFISFKHDWMLADFENRVMNVCKSPDEIKKHLGKDSRTWYFSSGRDKAAHIDLLDGYVQLWDGMGGHMGDFGWFYVAAAIQGMWNVVALEKCRAEQDRPGDARAAAEDEAVLQNDAESGVREVPQAAADSGTGDAGSIQEEKPEDRIADELAEIRRILKTEQKTLGDYLEVEKEGGFPEKLMFKQKTIVAALAAMVCELEDTESEPETEEKKQPELPVFRNNTQRKEWLNAWKDWGLWYRDDNIGVEYYKYDFDNGARLIAEVYQEPAAKYTSAYESCHLHLVGGPEPPKGAYGAGKWQRHTRYSKHPNSETELVEFLKEVQKNG